MSNIEQDLPESPRDASNISNLPEELTTNAGSRPNETDNQQVDAEKPGERPTGSTAAPLPVDNGDSTKGAGAKSKGKSRPRPKAPDGDQEEERLSQSQILIRLARSKATFFHTPDSEHYGHLQVGNHAEVCPLKSKTFKLWLQRLFFEHKGKAVSSEALAETLAVLEAQALFEGREHRVYVRVAQFENHVYLDLCNKDWEVVEIGADGWQIINYPPVKFRRSKSMLPLPRPERGGDLRALRRFLNAPDQAVWVLLIAWLVGSLHPEGPYLILVLNGEQGSIKSTAARILRSLLDPSKAPLRRPPRDESDLSIAAHNSWVIALDNLSSLPPWLADELCRLATGAGGSSRELYTNLDEVVTDAKRPIVIASIDDLISRNDLADRCVIVTLPPLPPRKRKLEREIWAEFEQVRPQILGALLDAVSAALRNSPTLKINQLPRMADAVHWIASAEEVLPWKPGTFLRVYKKSQEGLVRTALESDAVACAVRELVKGARSEWKGTATVLLSELNDRINGTPLANKHWPQTANVLTSRLRRAAPFLRQVGTDVQFHRRSGSRLITIRAKSARAPKVTTP